MPQFQIIANMSAFQGNLSLREILRLRRNAKHAFDQLKSLAYSYSARRTASFRQNPPAKKKKTRKKGAFSINLPPNQRRNLSCDQLCPEYLAWRCSMHICICFCMYVSDIFSDCGVILSQWQLILDHLFSHPSFVCNRIVDFIEDDSLGSCRL